MSVWRIYEFGIDTFTFKWKSLQMWYSFPKSLESLTYLQKHFCGFEHVLQGVCYYLVILHCFMWHIDEIQGDYIDLIIFYNWWWEYLMYKMYSECAQTVMFVENMVLTNWNCYLEDYLLLIQVIMVMKENDH